MAAESEWTIQSPSVHTHQPLVSIWVNHHSTESDAVVMTTTVGETPTETLTGTETIVIGTTTEAATVATPDLAHALTHHVVIEVIR